MQRTCGDIVRLCHARQAVKGEKLGDGRAGTNLWNGHELFRRGDHVKANDHVNEQDTKRSDARRTHRSCRWRLLAGRRSCRWRARACAGSRRQLSPRANARAPDDGSPKADAQVVQVEIAGRPPVVQMEIESARAPDDGSPKSDGVRVASGQSSSSNKWSSRVSNSDNKQRARARRLLPTALLRSGSSG